MSDQTEQLTASAERGIELVKRFASFNRLSLLPKPVQDDLTDLSNFLMAEALAVVAGESDMARFQGHTMRAVGAAAGLAKEETRPSPLTRIIDAEKYARGEAVPPISTR